jgi:pimeloyl-ACP methyl ester carboxylesterase
MPVLTSPDGLPLFYRDDGDGPAVVLLHGLTADGEMNWEWTGVAPALRAGGFRTIALDLRGHGRSAKPTEPEAYRDERFVADVRALLDHLGIDRCGLVGYSLGSLVVLRVTPDEPRVVAVVLGGIGERDIHTTDHSTDGETLARAMEIDDPDEIEDPEARGFREWADANGANRAALAALARGRRRDPFDLAAVTVPALVIAGADDHLAGDPFALAHRLPAGEGRCLAGDHTTALMDPSFGGEIVRFLSHHRR